jgi:hypothetical protein
MSSLFAGISSDGLRLFLLCEDLYGTGAKISRRQDFPPFLISKRRSMHMGFCLSYIVHSKQRSLIIES